MGHGVPYAVVVAHLQVVEHMVGRYAGDDGVELERLMVDVEVIQASGLSGGGGVLIAEARSTQDRDHEVVGGGQGGELRGCEVVAFGVAVTIGERVGEHSIDGLYGVGVMQSAVVAVVLIVHQTAIVVVDKIQVGGIGELPDMHSVVGTVTAEGEVIRTVVIVGVLPAVVQVVQRGCVTSVVLTHVEPVDEFHELIVGVEISADTPLAVLTSGGVILGVLGIEVSIVVACHVNRTVGTVVDPQEPALHVGVVIGSAVLVLGDVVQVCLLLDTVHVDLPGRVDLVRAYAFPGAVGAVTPVYDPDVAGGDGGGDVRLNDLLVAIDAGILHASDVGTGCDVLGYSGGVIDVVSVGIEGDL